MFIDMPGSEAVKDFRFAWDGGSVGLLTPQTLLAKSWVKDHIPKDAMRWGGGIGVEARYMEALLRAIELHGLTVEISRR